MPSKKKRREVERILYPRSDNGSVPLFCGSWLMGKKAGDKIDVWIKHENVSHTLAWNDPFYDVLNVKKVYTTGNAGLVVWQSVLTQATYHMRDPEFNKVIKGAEWCGPILVDGLWQVVRSNYKFTIIHIPPGDLP